jgi:hypothetical protein
VASSHFSLKDKDKSPPQRLGGSEKPHFLQYENAFRSPGEEPCNNLEIRSKTIFRQDSVLRKIPSRLFQHQLVLPNHSDVCKFLNRGSEACKMYEGPEQCGHLQTLQSRKKHYYLRVIRMKNRRKVSLQILPKDVNVIVPGVAKRC